MRKAVNHLRRADPVLRGIIEAVGPYRIQYTEPVFGSLVRSIVYQQLSGRVASVIYGRLLQAAGSPLRPSAILRLTPEEMRAVGLSRQKAASIRDLAEKARSIQFARLPDLPDEQVTERLTIVRGIGVWTAQMFLIFSLRRPNVLPAADLGVRMAIRKAWGLPELPTQKQVVQIAETWHPWCSVASWYLWRSLEIRTPEGAETAPAERADASDLF
jgi:DNA-3-methyladenine glycosylase II